MIVREKFVEWQARSRKIAQTGSGATSRRDEEGERSDYLDNITDEARRDSSDVGYNLVRFVEQWDGTGRKVAKKKIKNTVFSVPRQLKTLLYQPFRAAWT